MDGSYLATLILFQSAHHKTQHFGRIIDPPRATLELYQLVEIGAQAQLQYGANACNKNEKVFEVASSMFVFTRGVGADNYALTRSDPIPL